MNMASNNEQPTQAIVAARDFSSDGYRLLELNDDVEKAILAGERVTILGSASQRAVLCTSSSSYVLAKEDTSNLRLLTQHMEWKPEGAGDEQAPDIVTVGNASFHYVLQPKVADVTQLKALLLEAPYTKDKASSPSAKRVKLNKLYSTTDLVSKLQTSENELLKMLESLHAFEDAGTWRVLDPEYQTSVFADILDGVIQSDWEIQGHGVAVSDMTRVIDAPEIVIRQCCRVYGTIQEGDDGVDRCLFDSQKLAIFCAKQLFKEREQMDKAAIATADQGWPLEQFMDKWQLRVPESVKVDQNLLRSLALFRTPRGNTVRLTYFPEDELPGDPKQRFDRLFEVQEKWTVAQLEPYISSLVRPGVTQASLLLKYARSSRQGNSDERLYSKR